MKKLLTLALSLLAAGTVFAGEWADISIGDLKKAIAEKKVTLLDANGTKSYKAGHIPGAIDFKADAATIASELPADKNALVVAYCASPACQAYKAAAEKAKSLGYTNIKHLSAGITGWKEAGEPTDK